MFSGLRSQWITLAPRRVLSASSSCLTNTRASPMDSPRKLFWRSSSYRLMLSTSNTMHRWLRCTKWSIMRTMWQASRSSILVLSMCRMPISTCAWWKYAGWFLITFTATARPVPFSRHRTTCPNVPLPSTSRTSYSPLRRSSATSTSLTLMMRSEFSLSCPWLPEGAAGLVSCRRGFNAAEYPKPGFTFLYESHRYTLASATTLEPPGDSIWLTLGCDACLASWYSTNAPPGLAPSGAASEDAATPAPMFMAIADIARACSPLPPRSPLSNPAPALRALLPPARVGFFFFGTAWIGHRRGPF
mmetsp:Transcript_31001/g.77132  ORF Transcript_31001/g.77132 Transcript_31001/m.77132 type:complete len:302 (-) Transcript_31001:182-1087(-)